ncbi:PREDICTED: WAS protein family homolog 1-like isoform X2 [Cercocebus atys]|uniref:WAS protein family homolog 1-like isoform X2 n=1 Tax=Cercocebus atys TaxID=9531 RepID=UPI0005F374E8|nr:PREDICTED: WAS protein family homolog 1-like isoform X2 [Cercocebus atys]
MPPPPPSLPPPPPPGENPAIAPGPAQPLGNLRPPLQRNAPGSRKCVTEGEATGPSKEVQQPSVTHWALGKTRLRLKPPQKAKSEFHFLKRPARSPTAANARGQKMFGGRKTKAGSGGGLTVRVCLQRREGARFSLFLFFQISRSRQPSARPGPVAPRTAFGGGHPERRRPTPAPGLSGGNG